MVSGHESTYQVLRQIVALDLEKEALVVALSARSTRRCRPTPTWNAGWPTARGPCSTRPSTTR
jgi:hypothetical protein